MRGLGEELIVGFCRSWAASTCMGNVPGAAVWRAGNSGWRRCGVLETVDGAVVGRRGIVRLRLTDVIGRHGTNKEVSAIATVVF